MSADSNSEHVPFYSRWIFWQILARCLIFPFGCLTLFYDFEFLIQETPKFLDGRWEDISMKLRSLPKDTPMDVDTRFYKLPNENTAFYSLAISLASSRNRNRDHSTEWLSLFAAIVVVGYGSQVLSARWLMRFITWLTCQGQNSKTIRHEYFNAIQKRMLVSPLVGFGVTFLLCLLNGAFHWSEELEQAGLAYFDVVVVLVIVSYEGGLLGFLIVTIVDGAILTLGRDPHRTLWDEVVAVCLLAPTLYFVYQNSWLAVLSACSAGLVPGLFAKWRAHQEEKRELADRASRWDRTTQHAEE